jgi:ADP-heptose:LPS heptosyltransferase
MDSLLHVSSVKLTSGLGDCLIAGGMLQTYSSLINKKITYITSPVLEPILKFHPDIEYRFSGEADIQLLWAGQLKSRPYELHTIQRFSSQLGFYADPVNTLRLYDSACPIKHTRNSNIVCINVSSAEAHRRYIPEDYINFIVELCGKHGLEPTFIGNGVQGSVTNLKEQVELLRNCALFVGPVSFPFHLAGCILTPSLLFVNYMPAYKLSHFINVESVEPTQVCRHTCEKEWDIFKHYIGCHYKCIATSYSKEEIQFKFNKLLNKQL